MKKAVIATGGKQYLISEGEILTVELLRSGDKKLTLKPLLVINGDEILVGTPTVDKIEVIAEVVTDEVKAEKVTAIRYKAKKRVHKLHGHRQRQTLIKVIKIA